MKNLITLIVLTIVSLTIVNAQTKSAKVSYNMTIAQIVEVTPKIDAVVQVAVKNIKTGKITVIEQGVKMKEYTTLVCRTDKLETGGYILVIKLNGGVEIKRPMKMINDYNSGVSMAPNN